MASSRFGRWISYSPGRRGVLLLPLVFAVAAIVVLGIGKLPVKSIAGLRCDAVLDGGEPSNVDELAAPIRARATTLCEDATSGRRLAMLGVGIAILAVGLGAVLAPADRFERALTHAGEADERRFEEEARQAAFARETEARLAREREAQAVAKARQEAQERAAAERREARVAQARAARLRARAEAASGPTKKAGKKVARAKKAGTRSTKKVATKPKKVVTKSATATAKKATRTTRAAAKAATKASKVDSRSTSIKAAKAARPAPMTGTGTGPAEAVKAGTRTAKAKVGTRPAKAKAATKSKAVEAVDAVPAREPLIAAEPVTVEAPAIEDQVKEEVERPAEEVSPAPVLPERAVKKVGTSSRRVSRRRGADPGDRSEPVDGAPLL